MKKILLIVGLIFSVVQIHAMNDTTKLLFGSIDRISAIMIIKFDMDTTQKVRADVNLHDKFPLWEIESCIVPIVGMSAIGLTFINKDFSSIWTPSFITSCAAALYAVARSKAVDHAINEQKERNAMLQLAPHVE